VSAFAVDIAAIEEAAKYLYIRALKVLPDDIKAGFTKLDAAETGHTAKAVLATMIEMRLEMIPKGSGSENGSFLKMLIPADGIDGIKTFVIDRVMEAGGKVCPPTIVGVGIGGTSDLCMHIAKIAATRPLGSVCSDPEGAKLEKLLSAAVNTLGIGPQGLGGDSTAFAVHVETAATHITMNPVAVNIQCHSARRASATFSPDGLAIGF